MTFDELWEHLGKRPPRLFRDVVKDGVLLGTDDVVNECPECHRPIDPMQYDQQSCGTIITCFCGQALVITEVGERVRWYMSRDTGTCRTDGFTNSVHLASLRVQ